MACTTAAETRSTNRLPEPDPVCWASPCPPHTSTSDGVSTSCSRPFNNGRAVDNVVVAAILLERHEQHCIRSRDLAYAVERGLMHFTGSGARIDHARAEH